MEIGTSVAYRVYDLQSQKKAILFNKYSEKYMFLEGLSAELFEYLLANRDDRLKQWLVLNEITEQDVEKFKKTLEQFGCFEDDTEIIHGQTSIEQNEENNEKNFNPILKNFIEELHQNGLFYNFHIDLTYGCNEKCIHCYHPFYTYDFSKELNTSAVKELVDKMYEIGVFYVVLSGGEALLRKDIFEIIEYISNKGMLITLFTNGMLLSEEVVLKIKRYRIKTVSISLYSDIAEQHDKITTVKGSYSQTMKGIDLLKKYSIPFELKCVVLTENVSRVGDILSYFTNITNNRPCKIDFSLCGKLDGSCDVLQYMPQEEAIRKVFYSDPERFIGKRELLQRSPEQAPCYAGKYGLYCNAEGDIYPCVSFRLFLCNYKELHYISKNETLKKWRKVKIKDFSECFKHSYCNYCTEQCAGENLIENGDFLNSNVSHCVQAKIIEEWFNEHSSYKEK